MYINFETIKEVISGYANQIIQSEPALWLSRKVSVIREKLPAMPAAPTFPTLADLQNARPIVKAAAGAVVLLAFAGLFAKYAYKAYQNRQKPEQEKPTPKLSGGPKPRTLEEIKELSAQTKIQFEKAQKAALAIQAERERQQQEANLPSVGAGINSDDNTLDEMPELVPVEIVVEEVEADLPETGAGTESSSDDSVSEKPSLNEAQEIERSSREATPRTEPASTTIPESTHVTIEDGIEHIHLHKDLSREKLIRTPKSTPQTTPREISPREGTQSQMATDFQDANSFIGS